MPDQRFRQHERIKRPADFKLAYDRRRSAADDRLIVYGRENGLPHSRLGVSVSRKNGNSPARARLRRLYREAFRLSKAELPAGLDLVLIPKRPEPPPLAELRASLVKLAGAVARRLAREKPS